MVYYLFKKNRIKLLKLIITIVEIYFLLCVISEIISVFLDDIYITK